MTSHRTHRRFAAVTLPALLLVAALAACQAREAEASATTIPPAGDTLAHTASLDTAVFAGGCFWGVEGVFEHVRGVQRAISGFAGGTTGAPSYMQVGSGSTGHAESVEVIYDPSQVSYGQLLQVFFTIAHDPTEVNRQGPDVGTQYRSAIFYRTPAQASAARAYIAKLTAAKSYPRPIVTEVAPLRAFYVAEDEHQHYMALHQEQPYIAINDMPKLVLFRKALPKLYVTPPPPWG